MKAFKWNDCMANIILGAGIAAFGALIIGIVKTQNYTIWGRGGPGQGLFPMIAGGGIILCGIGVLIEAILGKRKAPDGQETKIIEIKSRELYNFCVVLGIAVIVVLLSEVLGFIPCVAVAMVLYTKLLSGENWLKSLVIGIGMGIVIYCIFVLFLKVHFPKGLLGI
ncbi:tripartite tricarboxylate transporter TctB family protein [Clostridium sp. AM58-1XD]|uniref:tripartite tricarboxylate transporter TctB family protein n=1 Tax=Clostridium sp. AM58-1XD TaxID=2292307 RepID=UPI0015F6E0DC|nr:tripartite tricarboxylate transporter TctB family protein [Clostridium sp. AM58-1XD]